MQRIELAGQRIAFCSVIGGDLRGAHPACPISAFDDANTAETAPTAATTDTYALCPTAFHCDQYAFILTARKLSAASDLDIV
jgi:hypothetical protein|tara:strand:- start:1502 stop:1747 length:246 start_codon:yes stop_codon:yes gene_type:complete